MSWIAVNLGFERRTPLGLCFVSFMGFLLCFFIHTTSSWAVSEEDKRWSFNFNNASVSNALDELTSTTGINIIANQIPNNNTMSKRYENKTIEEIVKDLFKGQNIGLVWHYGESGIDGLDIWVLDSAGGTTGSFSRIERPVSTEPPLRNTRKAPIFIKKEPEEETEESEEEVDEASPESPDTEQENEEEDADPGADSEGDSETDEKNESDEPEEKKEEETPVSIKQPEIED
jgi:hypothetical protein